jgi:hypothetical protein
MSQTTKLNPKFHSQYETLKLVGYLDSPHFQIPFNAFLDLFNVTHGKAIPFEVAVNNPVLVDAFLETRKIICPGNITPASAPVPASKLRKSTKRMSLDKTKPTISRAQQVVLNVLYASETPLSRKEIAEASGLSLSSVCARVHELVELEKVRVFGITFDPDTRRTVETLVSIH